MAASFLTEGLPEATLLTDSRRLIAGMDEVGRGSLAGPLLVGVALVTETSGQAPAGLTDSKQLSARQRQQLEEAIRAWAPAASGQASAAEIDLLGLTLALRLAGQRALANLAAQGFYPDFLLLDGSHNWLAEEEPDLFAALEESPAQSYYRQALAEAWQQVPGRPAGWEGPIQMEVKGDGRWPSISAASVLAKLERDALMVDLDQQEPAYGWAKNKGYGSAQHRQALTTQGPSSYHRLTWSLPISAQQLAAGWAAREEERK